VTFINLLQAAAIVTGAGQAVLDALVAEPLSGGVPAKMRTCLLVPGEIAWDGCDCGQFAQSVIRDYPSLTFPQEAYLDNRNACDPFARAVEVVASLTRCVPGMDSSGRPPTCDALRAAALIQQADALTMQGAIQCYLADLKRTYVITNYRIGGIQYVGPQGNCGGAEVRYLFALV
jgi:hypothetical protein